MNEYPIIITGINGFVGTNLSAFLKVKGKDTIGVSRNPSKNEISYKELTRRFLSNSKSLIHLSGIAHDIKNNFNEENYFNINTELTKNIFDTFLESKCKNFIFLSSVKAVSDEVLGILTEDTIPNPIGPYGKSKLSAEKYIFSKKIPKNKRVYILRPCMIHGPGNKGNLTLLYKFVSNGLPWPLGSFDNKRSFCSIENVLFVILELIENNNILSGVYNLADDKPLSTNEVIGLISKSKNRNPIIWSLNKNFIQLIAKIGGKVNLPLNPERLKKLTESYVVSNTKIIKQIGKSLPVSSKKGMLKTFNSFK
ncbi:NAD-dependent epimerase/dehydratase family protein [Flavobacteriaceae bacterium]|nr:NAD-dependent epimerase/dehydratase family protein [Flavobacteriaceae bacterium]